MREPLLQFLAVASLLFLANHLFHGPTPSALNDSITISKGRVEQLAESYRLLAGRMPSHAELQALVADFVDEEIDYREAIAMGLDTNDTIVRRRMRQKLEFLVADTDAVEEPDDAQLAAWLKAHAADYRLPQRIAFRQVLASRDTRGVRAESDAATFLLQLRSGADPEKLGEASMLPAVLTPTTQQEIASLFGDAFAAKVFEETGSDWFGPVSSPFGAHDVQILTREAASEPTVNELRDKLRSDWIEAQRRAKRDAFQSQLRKRYQVQIDWPKPYEGSPALSDIPRIERPLDSLIGE
jgi:hypothetical protein